MKKRICLAVILATAASPSFAEDECAIDQVMRDKRVAMNKHAKQKIDQGSKAAMDGAADVKTGSCVAILDDLDGLLRARVPSLGGMAAAGVINKVRDMACDMALQTVTQMAERTQANIGDPYGIVSVGVGGTMSGNGGAAMETYDIGEVFTNAAGNAVGDAVRRETGQVINDASSGIKASVGDRNPRSVESTASEVSRGAVNEAINGL